jgi:hypothetical protein
VRSAGHNLTGYLKTRNIGDCWRWRIFALTLQYIGTIDTRGCYPY